jgi:type II secretory pathway pseudopilin PulG
MFNKMEDIKSKKSRTGGFSLIELIVASTVFVTVMVLSGSAVYTVFNSNQKSKNMRSVMDNLNLSLESMTRTIRFGDNYHCSNTGTPSQPLDCPNNTNGANFLEVRDMDGVQVRFDLDTSTNRIRRTKASVVNYVTSPDVFITAITFRVYGSANFTSGNRVQPRVNIVISGYVGLKTDTRSTFTIETTVSQRRIDFQ